MSARRMDSPAVRCPIKTVAIRASRRQRGVWVVQQCDVLLRLLQLEVTGFSEVYGYSSSAMSYSTLCLGPSGVLILRWWSVVMKFR